MTLGLGLSACGAEEELGPELQVDPSARPVDISGAPPVAYVTQKEASMEQLIASADRPIDELLAEEREAPEQELPADKPGEEVEAPKDGATGSSGTHACTITRTTQDFLATLRLSSRGIKGNAGLSFVWSANLNGDQFDDLLLGEGGSVGRGTVHGVLGSATFINGSDTALTLNPNSTGIAAFRIHGEASGDYLGSNNNGFFASGRVLGGNTSYVLMSAAGNESAPCAGQNCGKIYVILPTAIGTGDVFLDQNPAAVVAEITGVPGGQARVVATGDLDDDGVPDIAVGQPGANGGDGNVVVIKGGAGLPAAIDLSNLPGSGAGSAIATLNGSAACRGIGNRPYVIANFGGATAADIAIGCPARNNGAVTRGGVVYIVRGPLSGSLTLDTQSTTRILGANLFGHFGTGVAAGDVNGDAAAASDLIVGSEQAHRPGFPLPNGMRGAVMVFSGAVGIPTGDIDLAAGNVPMHAFYGDSSAALAGHSLFVSDLDNDGDSDILVSQSGEDSNGRQNAGSVSAIQSHPTMPALDIIEEVEVFRGSGPRSNGFFGYPFQGLHAADVNGDGYEDFCFATETGGVPIAAGGAVYCKDVFDPCH